MDVEDLFLYTLQDLERRISSIHEYDVLMSAALLRKLLLDGRRLTDEVNRTYRLKLRFRISSESPIEKMILEDNPVFWSLEDALDPESPFAYEPFYATRDEFLSRKIMRFNGHWISVEDMIDQLANVEGAVHSGTPGTNHRRVIQAAGKFFSRSGLPGIVSQMRLIGRIVLSGLGPLRDAVLAAQAAKEV